MLFTFINKTQINYFKNGSLYFGGSIIQLVLSLITFPIYAKYLSAVEFGILGYYTSLIQFFTPIFILSTTNIYLMKYFRQSDDENKYLLFNLLFFLTVINFITSIISYIGLYIYFIYGNVSIPFWPYTLIILCSVLIDSFNTFTLLNFRIKKMAYHFFLLTTVNAFLNAIFSVMFVVEIEGGAIGRLSGPLAAKIIITLICFRFLRKWVLYKIDFGVFKNAIKLAIPLIISAYAYIPIQSLDRIMLERLNNTSELGFYSIGSQIAGFLLLAFMALFQAFEPDFYKHLIYNNIKKLGTNIFFFVGFLVIALLIFLFTSSALLELLTSGKYTRAYTYANIIALGSTITVLVSLVSSIILANERTKLASLITYIGGLCSLFIYPILIKLYQFKGAAYGRIVIPLLMLITGLLVLYIRDNSLLKKHL